MTPSDQVTLPASERPQRLHPFTMLFAALSVGRRFLLPAIIGGVSAGGGETGDVVRWILGILAVPALGFAVAKYATFRFRLGAEELVIDSGVLQRKHRVIPLARVQNIELRQGVLQTFCGVVEVRVETAGGGGETEAVLSVLDREAGETLREQLLARRRGAAGDIVAPSSATEPQAVVTRLAHLSPRDLAIAGATANQAGLIAAGLLGLLQFVDDLPFVFPAPVRELTLRWEEAGAVGVAVLLLIGVVLLVIVGWVVSIVGSVVGYHDFTLDREGNELRKRYGLVSRREASVPLERVQSVRVEESLLRRPFGLATLKIESAGGNPGERQRGGAEAFLPLARREEIDCLVAGVFPDVGYGGLHLTGVHPSARRRLVVRYALRLLLLAAFLAVVARAAAWVPLALLPIGVGLAHWQYRNRGYATLPGYIIARRGVFNRITWIIPERKLQTLHATQDPFQRRLGLASLTVDTAAGGRVAAIVDLARQDALGLAAALAERVPAAVRDAARSRSPRRPLGRAHRPRGVERGVETS